MQSKTFNLDENVSESFEFTVRGNTYIFRYPTTGEMVEVLKIINEAAKEGNSLDVEDRFMSILYSFITPKSKDVKPFDEIYPSLISPQQKNFVDMVRTEVLLQDAGN